MDFVIEGLAGAGTTVFTNPFDVVKTRLGVYHIAEENGFTRKKNGDVCMEKAMFWSEAGSFMGGICCNPILVVKTRLQSAAHPCIAVGRQYDYNGTLEAFFKIYKFEGIKDFFTGVSATATRLTISYTAQLTTFFKAKESLLSKGFFQSSPFSLTFAASEVSGIVVVLVGCPLEVAAVRLYNRGVTQRGEVLYTGIVDCLIKIYRTEGLHGLYKGIGPLYLKLAPTVTITLVIWDFLNDVLRSNKSI